LFAREKDATDKDRAARLSEREKQMQAHVEAAYNTYLYEWTAQQRQAFADERAELIALRDEIESDAAKFQADAEEWLRENKDALEAEYRKRKEELAQPAAGMDQGRSKNLGQESFRPEAEGSERRDHSAEIIDQLKAAHSAELKQCKGELQRCREALAHTQAKAIRDLERMRAQAVAGAQQRYAADFERWKVDYDAAKGEELRAAYAAELHSAIVQQQAKHQQEWDNWKAQCEPLIDEKEQQLQALLVDNMHLQRQLQEAHTLISQLEQPPSH
jgi:hypothetical protein